MSRIETSALEAVAWAWHLGGGALTLAAGAALLVGAPLEVAWLVLVLGAVGVARQRSRFRGAIDPEPAISQKPTSLPIARLALAVATFSAIVLAWTTPLPGWDGLAIWGYKAKLLTLDAFDAAWLRDPLSLPAHPEYPLHVPLRTALVARVVGWHDALPMLLVALDVAALYALLLGALERGASEPGHGSRLGSAGHTLAFVFALAVPALFDEVPQGYADPTLALAVVATLVALGRWLRRGARADLVLAAGAAGVGAWTKQEGLVLLAVAFASAFCVAFLANRPKIPLVGAGAVGIAIAAPWHVARSVLGIETEPFGWRGVEQLERIPPILAAILGEMSNVERWGLLWPAAAVALVVQAIFTLRRRRDSASLLPGLFLLTSLGAYVAIYVSTPHDLDWHLATSLHRLLLQLVPAAMLVVVEGLRASTAQER